MADTQENRKVQVELKKVNKVFGDNHVVHNLDMKIYQGEFLTILGSSGCGKTTILRMIGGFETPTDGEILLAGKNIAGLSPYQIHVNTVFQSYALFPHLDVFDNIAYGLRLKKMPKKEIQEKVMEMLEMVRLSGFEHRRISQLSGGQKQRIAIARALVNDPEVLLLDEPLGALDLQLRKQMQVELKRLQKKFGITFIFVTHDQEEAMTMSDRIAVMNGGFLEQLGTPKEVYEHPRTRFVADFIGETNSFVCHVKERGEETAVCTLETGTALAEADGLKTGEVFYLSIRPEKMKFSRVPQEGFTLQAQAKEVLYVGGEYKGILVMPNGHEIRIRAPFEEGVPIPGETVFLWWDIKDAVIIHSPDNDVFEAVDQMNLLEGKKVKVHG